MMTSPLEVVRHLFKVMSGLNLPPRYNIAPTQAVTVVFKDDEGTRQMLPMRWGFVPAWAKEIPSDRPLINARAESIAEKPTFRAAYRRRRCLVPANGFYEWKTSGGKQPMFISLEDQKLFAFAGIWEMWQGSDGGSALQSMAIVTRPAYPSLEHIHHRMPVILNEDSLSGWLDCETGAMDDGILAPETAFRAHPVSTRVNSVKHGDEGLIAEVTPEKVTPREDTQLSLF